MAKTDPEGAKDNEPISFEQAITTRIRDAHLEAARLLEALGAQSDTYIPANQLSISLRRIMSRPQNILHKKCIRLN